ncbi:MAG: isomerizing glutamine--fructose-6-phosphate transaminase, partial [Halobacteriaceae archaeon]
MCGITGYVGNRNGLNIVASSLKNLEYRGYDSAGVAINDGGITVYKQAGEIDDLSLPFSTSTATTAIGHTRWSTHGKPTDANAHPHTDCTGEIAVVHNGIIDNYTTLKEELTDRHTFTSETDTEVIPHLLEDELRSGIKLVEAVARVTDVLEGSYAFAVTVEDNNGIVASRQDSPLVIGHGENEHYLASDVPAFIDHTRKVTYLQDGDIAHLTADSVTIYNEGEVVEREITTVDWDAEAAEKGGFDHYMAKEIHEQPKALRQAITGRIDTLNGTANIDIELPEEFLQSMNEIHIVAAGTSYHAALYTKELLESYTD